MNKNMNKKYNKKRLIAILLISTFYVGGIIGPLYAVSMMPQPSSEVPSDWLFSNIQVGTYDYYSNYMELRVDIQSPSNSLPSEVIAAVNATNYTMKARHMDFSGAIRETNISNGIRYYLYLENLNDGEYLVEFFALNSTSDQRLGYNITQNVNYTNALENPIDPFLLHDEVGHNSFRFYTFCFNHYICTEIAAPKLFIWEDGNESNVILENRSGIEYSQYRYEYFYTFPKNDSNTYRFRWEWYLPELNHRENATNFFLENKFSTTEATQDLWIGFGESYSMKEDGFYVLLYPNFENWENEPPRDAWLELNGTRYEIPLTPVYEELYGTTYYECKELDWREGIELVPIELVLEYNSTANITVFWNNGTLNEPSIQNNSYYYDIPAYYGVSEFEATLNVTLVDTGTNEVKFNATAVVQSDFVDFDAIVDIRYLTPQFDDSSNWRWTNDGNEPYSEGKTFTTERSLGNADSLVGNMDFIFIIYTWYDGGLSQYPHVFVSDPITIENEATESGEYGLDLEKWYEFTSLERKSDCLNITFEDTLDSRFKIISQGRKFGYDYFEYIEENRLPDDCEDTWRLSSSWNARSQIMSEYNEDYEFNYFDEKPWIKRIYIDPNNPETYPDLFIPLGAEQLLFEHYNEWSLEDSVWTFDEDENSMEYYWESENAVEIFFKTIVDGNTGLITYRERNIRRGTTKTLMIYEHKPSVLFPDYVIYIIVAVIVIGVVLAILQKKKAKAE